MNTEARVFPQLKFYDMMLCWSYNANSLPPGWPVVAPIITPMVTADHYDHEDDQWYLPVTAIFTLSNGESVKAHWPLANDQTKMTIKLDPNNADPSGTVEFLAQAKLQMRDYHEMSDQSFESFCHAQAAYLEAQLFKLEIPEKVSYHSILKRKRVVDQYTYEVSRYTRGISVYQQVLQGQEVGPYVIRVK